MIPLCVHKNAISILPPSKCDRIISGMIKKGGAMKGAIFCGMLFIFSSLQSFKLGLENISPATHVRLQNKRIALVTNQTGVDQQGRRNVDLLQQQGITLRYLCAPEHGLFGTIEAGKGFGHHKDPASGLEIVSLYTKDNHRVIDHSLVHAVDLFLFDIQDAGMRHYTYISTLYKLIEVAARHDKEIVILDRPNFLGPIVEGPSVDKPLLSFIGIAPIPVRHGMTIGEIGLYFNKYFFDNKADVNVIEMAGYRKGMPLNGYWPAPLSPNIPTKQSLYGYSFLGLLGEVGPFDIGIGTDAPFQRIGLPNALGIQPATWDALRTVLKRNNIDSSWCHYTHPVKNKSYVGLKIVINDISKVSSMRAFMAIMDFFKKQNVSFEFKTFDKSIGTTVVREYFQNKRSKDELLAVCNNHLKKIVAQIQTVVLYEPALTFYAL